MMNLFEYEKENMEIITLKENNSFDFILEEPSTKIFDFTELCSVNMDCQNYLVFNNASDFSSSKMTTAKIFNVTSLKKGRKKFKNDKNKSKHHDKFFSDNILRKVQCHYLNFIVSFMNEILRIFNFKEKLLYLDYRFKSNVNKKAIIELKNSTIKDIFYSSKISYKFKLFDRNHNIDTIKKIEKNEIINRILSENYLSFFNIYYKSSRTINLSNYGLNQIITLSKNIKMYQDLKNIFNDETYRKKLNECIVRNFLSKPIFLCK